MSGYIFGEFFQVCFLAAKLRTAMSFSTIWPYDSGTSWSYNLWMYKA